MRGDTEKEAADVLSRFIVHHDSSMLTIPGTISVDLGQRYSPQMCHYMLFATLVSETTGRRGGKECCAYSIVRSPYHRSLRPRSIWTYRQRCG